MFQIARRVLITCGILLFLLAAFADLLGGGESPGIGATQIVIATISLVLVAIGVVDRRGKLSVRVLLAGFSAAITFLAIEGAYRYVVNLENPALDSNPINYRLSPNVIQQFDEQHGYRYKPNREWWNAYIVDGQVRHGTVIIRSNADGLAGKTTIAEYRQRQLKIVVFGDSFTAWNQSDVTWPDLFELELSQRLETSVGVLNFGQGGYGIIQMLELAAAEISRLEPDLVIFAPISADFSRPRYWIKELVADDQTRMIRSTRKDEFRDYRFALDQLMIDARATPEWCQRILNDADTAADKNILAETNERFRSIRRDNYQFVCKSARFDWNRSYVLERITKREKFQPLPAFPGNPRVTFDDFADDREVVRCIAELHRLKSPMLLVHLPVADEATRRQAILGNQEEHLLHSLERLMNQEFVFPGKDYNIPLPEKIDLQPIDLHPNYDGLKWYASVIAECVERRYDRQSRWRQ